MRMKESKEKTEEVLEDKTQMIKNMKRKKKVRNIKRINIRKR